MLNPLIAEKEEKLRQLLDPESTSKTRGAKGFESKAKKGKFEAKYNFSDLYPGMGEGPEQMTFEGGVAVNLASSIT